MVPNLLTVDRIYIVNDKSFLLRNWGWQVTYPAKKYIYILTETMSTHPRCISWKWKF